MKLDYIYVINLKTDSNVIHGKMKNIPLPYGIKYYISPAVNGWELDLNDSKIKAADWWNIKSTNRFWNREVTPGEMGCTLSHLNIIENAYKEGFESILVLEEDFIPQGKFPTEEELNSIPKDASVVYLDRNALNSEKETPITDSLTTADYSYNTHAIIYTKKGMKEIFESSIKTNLIATDEFISAINGTIPREDALTQFANPDFKAYAFRGGYFKQSSNPNNDSMTEFNPNISNIVDENKPLTKIIPAQNLPFPSLSSPSLLNTDNWEEWCNKYIHPMVRKGEYELLVDEPIINCYEFPFFTKQFCDEIIVLSETKEWKKDRHKFYPTTDNLLEVLGIGEIYTRVINEFVRPLAIWAYGLEGTSWDVIRDESFIIRYRADEQSHLSLHHDYSNLTILVNLNPGEFEGGGTYFPKYKALSNPKQIGTMTLHPGNITHKHGARPVLNGTRYVLVSFLKSSSHL